jgi:tetratricopeptide (TPR) repeat protein
VGRRREERRILQFLRNPDGAGVLLHGLGGAGKSSLSAEVLKNLAEEGWLIATTFSRISPNNLLYEVGQRFLRQFQREKLSETDRRCRLAVEIRRPDIDWEYQFQALAQELLSERPLIILLDNFEDNFAQGVPGEPGADFHLHNEDLANLLASWLIAPGKSRFLITSRHPFELPQKAHRRLDSLHLGPLSPAETRKLLWRLPALDALSHEDQMRIYNTVGSHPRALEYLDALLRGGKARFPDVTLRIEDALEKRGIRDPMALLSKSKGDLNQALAETVILAVDDIFLDHLIDRLQGVPLAEDLLIGASVYQVPVDIDGLAWQVSEEVEIPENTERIQQVRELQKTMEEILERGEPLSLDLVEQWDANQRELLKPPLQVPDELGGARDVLSDLGLLASVETNEERASLYFVHRWTASRVFQRCPADKIQAAHRKAARYWSWRVAEIPQDRQQDVEDLLQERHHYKEAGEIDAALRLTNLICSQLDTWGAYRREEQLYKETLSWVPEHSTEAAVSIHNLGIIAQQQGNYNQALNWYKKSLRISEELGNRDGMARSYYRIGIVAQYQGDYDLASECYKKSLHISEELGNRDGMARSYHQLGIVAQDRGDYEQALDWYKKSLHISEELGNRDGMARSYHQIGMVVQDRGDYNQALDWYKKSLQINEELGNRDEIARSYHQIGIVAQDRGDDDQALDWYRKSLLISEELGDRVGMARSYHQLGIVAQNRSDYDQALDWYKKSLLIKEELGDRVGMALTTSQLGVLWTEHGQPEDAVPLNLRSLSIRLQIGIPEIRIDLQWLNRQRELLGEKRFGEILREHLSEEDSQTVLELMNEVSSPEEG